MKKHIFAWFLLVIGFFIVQDIQAAAPTVSASGITFSSLTNTSVRVSWTNGNGASRMLVASQGAPVSWTPTDFTQVSGVNLNFASATDQGGGNKVVYSSNSNTATITGLTSGQTYYFVVYEYNGTNSVNPYTAEYRLTTAPTANTTTLVPVVSAAPLSLSGFISTIGGFSTEQSYTVSGTGLFNKLVVASGSADYKVSLTPGGPYTATVSITPVSNVVNNTTIYVVLNPSGAVGTKSATLTTSSTGATSQLVSVTGTAVASTPTVAASNLSISSVSSTSFTISCTAGNGARRIIVVRDGAAVNWTPTNYASLTGVNSIFTSAADQGSGNKVLSSGTGTSVNVTGLTAGATYYVTVYEFNGSHTSSPATAAFYTTGAPTASATTLGPDLVVAPTSLSGFSTTEGTTSAQQTFTVSGTNLVANVSLTAPTGFRMSTVSGGPYTTSLNLVPSSGTLSATTIYVALVASSNLDPGPYSGNITVTSTDASTKYVAVSGTITEGAPTTPASNITFTSVTTTSARINFTSGNGTARIVVMRQGSAVSWTPTNQTQLTGVSSNFGSASDQGSGNKVVYNSTNNFVDVSGLTTGLTYHVAIYEYIGNNTSLPYTVSYLITGAPVANFTTLAPSISVNPGSLSSFLAPVGSNSPEQTYTVSGTQLSNLLVVSPGNPYFRVSLVSGGPYTSSVSLTPVSGTVAPTTIYVVLSSTAPSGNYSGSIQNSSTGATSQFVNISGTAYNPRVYVWVGATSLNWQTATNWSPNRVLVTTTDTLRFNSSPSGVVFNVPSETLPKLEIRNGASVVLQGASGSTTIALTLPTASGSALNITSGSSLSLIGTNAQTLSIASGSTASVNGSITLANANHTLGGAGTWTFGSTSTVTYSGGADQTVAALNYNNLTLSSTNTKTLPAAVIGIAGTFTNNSSGPVVHNNGTVNFTGAASFVGGSSVTDFYNLSLADNAALTLTASENLIGTLVLGNNTSFTTTGYTFTLVSNASGTARIDVVPGSANIVGSISMQRYLPASGGRYWYHLASPFSDATLVQLKTANTTSLPSNPDNGIFITGTGISNTTPDIPGIGIFNTTTPSVYYFSTAGNAWVKPTDLASVFPAKTGYRFFIRDGSAALAPTTGAKYLTLSGTPNAGNLSFTLLYSAASAGWNFLGNPYPSDITADLSNGGWNTASANLVNNTVYIWNSDANAYVTCLNGTPSSAGACTIPSFQGFWVATSAPGTLIATENVKVSGSSVIFRTSSASSYAIPVTLRNTDSDVAHGTLIRLDREGTSLFDKDLDAEYKFPDGLEGATTTTSVFSSVNGVNYSINTIAEDGQDILALNISAPAGKNTLSFEGLSLPQGVTAYLYDQYEGTSIVLEESTRYEFYVDHSPASTQDRFSIIFNPGSARQASQATLQASLTVFPNPSASGRINLILTNAGASEGTIVMYDSYGTLVKSQTLNGTTAQLETEGLKPGIYTVICSAGAERYTAKVVVE